MRVSGWASRALISNHHTSDKKRVDTHLQGAGEQDGATAREVDETPPRPRHLQQARGGGVRGRQGPIGGRRGRGGRARGHGTVGQIWLWKEGEERNGRR